MTRRYEAVTKEKMLLKLERDRLASKVTLPASHRTLSC